MIGFLKSWWLTIFLLVLIFAFPFGGQNSNVKNISISEFISEVNNGNIKQTNNGKFNAAYAAELKNIFNIINILIDITKDDKVSKQIIELDKVLDKNSNYATDLFDFIKRNIVTSVNALARNNNFSKYSKQIQTVLCTEICADILEKQNFNTKLISAIDFVFLDILYLIKK